ncbi:putative membrane protein [Desulfosporosinus acidiphilus SJ4]|uniref:Putative manganese efflux pump MntP n=1 Tax=Desulfosporosinus acidiphilus (strain DSM 22704 / JCM 16185 / SJ4) TaxID=646529 RepID=I4DCF2_DESAJ|nr:manganese efflux pump MntP family protein [Desulfosporosinus acidiphilus]AFM43476.1 putative membrane protein [Desulfosporosinus acidiphilus SJ4]
MNLAWVIAVAIALGTDAFSLSLAIGLSGIRKGLMLKLIIVVAAFHVLMPLGGMILGQALGAILGQFASWIGAVIIIGLGGHVFYKVYRPTVERFSFAEAKRAMLQRKLFRDISYKGWSLYVLAASVSLDALTVGFSLGTFGFNILISVMVMGLIAGLMTGLGLFLGRIIGTRLGDKAELLGGIALFLIGVKLLF